MSSVFKCVGQGIGSVIQTRHNEDEEGVSVGLSDNLLCDLHIYNRTSSSHYTLQP